MEIVRYKYHLNFLDLPRNSLFNKVLKILLLVSSFYY